MFANASPDRPGDLLQVYFLYFFYCIGNIIRRFVPNTWYSGTAKYSTVLCSLWYAQAPKKIEGTAQRDYSGLHQKQPYMCWQTSGPSNLPLALDCLLTSVSGDNIIQ